MSEPQRIGSSSVGPYAALRQAREALGPYPRRDDYPSREKFLEAARAWDDKRQAAWDAFNATDAGRSGLERAKELVDVIEALTGHPIGAQPFAHKGAELDEVRRERERRETRAKRARLRERVKRVFLDGAKWAARKGTRDIRAIAETYAMGEVPER